MSTLCPESFGIITRKVVPRTATERMQDWLRNLAPIRAAAVCGDESTLDFAPNVVPMRRPLSRMQVVRAALEDHCRMLGLSDDIAEDAIARCRYWLAQDTTLSSGALISKGKVRCSMFHESDPKGCA